MPVDATRTVCSPIQPGTGDDIQHTIRAATDVVFDIVDSPVEADLGRGIGVFRSEFVGSAMADDFGQKKPETGSEFRKIKPRKSKPGKSKPL